MNDVFREMFRALGHRNFRLFFMGQSVSLVGTWIQQVATGWLVYRLTESPVALGSIFFLGQIPILLLGPFAGFAADTFDRRKFLMLTQSMLALQAFLLAFLALTGRVNILQLMVLTAFMGVVTAFDVPVRQSFVIEMVGNKKDLGNAIALNSLTFNAARLVGPSIGGIIIALYGEGMCFMLNALSFFSVILSLAAMKISPVKSARPRMAKIFSHVKDGISYAFGFAPIRAILLLVAVVSLAGMSYIVLLPVFARDVLSGGAETLGFLMASGGIGALAATAYIAARKSVLGLGRRIPIFLSAFAISLIIFSMSRSLLLSFVLMGFIGFGLIAGTSSCNMILQTIVDDDKRGRVMSLYGMAFLGSAPFGSLLFGVMAARIGASFTLIAGALACLLASFIFARNLPSLKKHVHPIYIRMGIIKEAVKDIDSTAGVFAPPAE